MKRPLTRILIVCLILPLVNGCSQHFDEMVGEPPLSPVGSGFREQNVTEVGSIYPVSQQEGHGWVGGAADLFRDRRAHKVGDILTVDISINDRAALNSTSNESRKSSGSADLGFGYEIEGNSKADIKGKGDINSNSSATGQGSTARSEKINLSVAAVVTAVLPNQYLVIKGTQEIKVNAETRILNVSGVVHPRDISEHGFVPYDKIAEARISYGGHGAIADVQKPGWGQRIWNKLAPF